MTYFLRIVFVIMVCVPLLAWDTRTTPRLAWHAPYGVVGDGVVDPETGTVIAGDNVQIDPETGRPIPGGAVQAASDIRSGVPEHTRISDLALRRLGVADLFGQNGEAALSVVDLNASYFRREDLYGVGEESNPALRPFGDLPQTLLEERRIAAPAHMVGLPDYSYSILDWLNKTQFCPASRDGADLYRCHEFIGWLGALNSVHFGSQATEMYERYHGIALRLAARAREMRESMTPAEQALHNATLLEAEIEALTYEAFAQHFLQDRWSMGHMFERWNGGDANQAAYSLQPGAAEVEQYPALAGNLSVAAMAGAIHGWEGVTRDHAFVHAIASTADPLSAPYIDGNRLIMPQYRHTSRGNSSAIDADSPELLNGVGDERFSDMLSGGFGAGYGELTGDLPINVRIQQESMLACSMAGWATVIQAFGETGNGFGAHGANLAVDALFTDPVDQPECWDMWATNRSMWLGFVGQDVRALVTLTALSIESDLRVSVRGPALGRSDIARLGWRIWRRQYEDPHGTYLAQGGIGELWGVQHGGHYYLPNFVEPLDLSELPPSDPRGLDRRALFGAFSRAHSDHWCEEREYLLEEVRTPVGRDQERTIDQQVCQYVASMAYQGTHPAQISPLTRTLTTPSGAEARSMCALSGSSESLEADNRADPFYLDVGYIDWREDAAPHTQYVSQISSARELAEWCARTPVLEFIEHEGDISEHLVAMIEPENTEIVIRGQDLGDQPGRIRAENEETGEIFDIDFTGWNNASITLASSGGLAGQTDQYYRLDVTTHDGRTSVGLFRIFVEAPPPLQVVFAEAIEFTGIQPCRETRRDLDWTACSCSAEATRSGGNVWGTFQYEMDSAVCRAALHAGAVGPAGGNVLVRNIETAPYAFFRSTANGVETLGHNGTASAFEFGAIPVPAWAETGIPLCPFMVYGSRMPTDQECLCIPQLFTDRNVWGTGVYTHDSNLCRAAVHAGAYNGQMSAIRVLTDHGGRSDYTGSERNGVESLDWSQPDSSIVIYRSAGNGDN